MADHPHRMSTYCMAPNTLGQIGGHATVLPCQRQRGHEPPHRYAVEWFDALPVCEACGTTQHRLIQGRCARCVAAHREAPVTGGSTPKPDSVAADNAQSGSSAGDGA